MFLARSLITLFAIWVARAGGNAASGYLAQMPLADYSNQLGAVPSHVRVHWMQRAVQALNDLESPCPTYAFGTAIVNHTSDSELGELVCIGANAVKAGNPSLHGEIAGISNCTAVLTDPNGTYRLPADSALAAFKDLTLYTTAEPCPMCASAIRWAGFKECVFGTSIAALTDMGWSQIQIHSHYVFEQSWLLGPITKLIGGVLSDETDTLFAWQYDSAAPCPKGCGRSHGKAVCLPP